MTDNLNQVQITNIINNFPNKLLTIIEFLDKLKIQYDEQYLQLFYKNIKYNNMVILTNEILKILFIGKVDILCYLIEYYIYNIDYIIYTNKYKFNTLEEYNDKRNYYDSISDNKLRKESLIEGGFFNENNEFIITIKINIYTLKQILLIHYNNENIRIQQYNNLSIIEKINNLYSLYENRFYKNHIIQINNILNDTNIIFNISNTNKIYIKEYVYIISTSLYEKDNMYKIGRTNNLKSRLSTYNTGKHKDDLYYYCFTFGCNNSIELENILKNKFKIYSESKSNEIIKLNINELLPKFKEICNNYNLLYEYNQVLQQNISN